MRRTTLPFPALAFTLAAAVLHLPAGAQDPALARSRSLAAETAAVRHAPGQIPILPPASGTRDAPAQRPEAGAPLPPRQRAGDRAIAAPEWFPGEPELTRSPRYGADSLESNGAPPEDGADSRSAPELQTWGLLLMCLCAVALAVARYGLHDRAVRVARRS